MFDLEGNNRALKKTATQSSTYSAAYYGIGLSHPASEAVDGNIHTFPSVTFSLTKDEQGEPHLMDA